MNNLCDALEPRRLFAAAINYGGFRIADGSTRLGFAEGNKSEDLLLERTSGPYAGITTAAGDSFSGFPYFDYAQLLTRDEPREFFDLGSNLLEDGASAIGWVDQSSTGLGTLHIYQYDGMVEVDVYSSERFNADYLRLIPLDLNGDGFTDLAVVYGPLAAGEDQRATPGAHVWILTNDQADNLNSSALVALPDDFTGAITAAYLPGYSGDVLVAGESSGKVDVISSSKSGSISSKQFAVGPAGDPIINLVPGDFRKTGFTDVFAVAGTDLDSNGHLTGSIIYDLQPDKNGNLDVGPNFVEPHKVIPEGAAAFGSFGHPAEPGLVYTGISTSSHVLQDTSLITRATNGDLDSQSIWYSGGKDGDLATSTLGGNESVIFEYAQTAGPDSHLPPAISLYELGDLNAESQFPLAGISAGSGTIVPPFPSDSSDSDSLLNLLSGETEAFSVDPSPTDSSIPILYRTNHSVFLIVENRNGDVLEQYLLVPGAKHSVQIPTDNDPATIRIGAATTDQNAQINIRYDY